MSWCDKPQVSTSLNSIFSRSVSMAKPAKPRRLAAEDPPFSLSTWRNNGKITVFDRFLIVSSILFRVSWLTNHDKAVWSKIVQICHTSNAASHAVLTSHVKAHVSSPSLFPSSALQSWNWMY